MVSTASTLPSLRKSAGVKVLVTYAQNKAQHSLLTAIGYSMRGSVYTRHSLLKYLVGTGVLQYTAWIIPIYCGIFKGQRLTNILEYPTIMWYTGVPRYTVVYWRVYRSTPVYCGILEYPGILWYTVVYWSTPVYCGILWYTGVPWYTVHVVQIILEKK